MRTVEFRLVRLAMLGLVGLSLGCAPAPPGPAPSATTVPARLVEFRMVAEVGASAVEGFEYGGETLQLEREAVASDSDLASLVLTRDEDRWQLDVRFTPTGGVRFDQALLDDAGRQVALVVDSRVWRVLDVRSQLGASVIRATLEIADAEAARLQGLIDTRWP